MSCEAPCTLASYASPIEAAIAVNLLLAGWAALRDRISNRNKSFAKEVEQLDAELGHQERIAMSQLHDTLEFWGKWGRGLWRVGLASGLLAAGSLYVALWHFQSVAVGAWLLGLLWTAAYLNPAAMVGMWAAERRGHRIASRQKDILDEAAKRLREDSRSVQQTVHDRLGRNVFVSTSVWPSQEPSE